MNHIKKIDQINGIAMKCSIFNSDTIVHSRHAKERSQQRGIAPIVVDLLDTFGSRAPDGRGAEIVYFDRNAKKRIRQYTGGLVKEDELDKYLVMSSDGKIITVGKRYKPIHRK